MINDSSNTLATRLERLAPLARNNYEGSDAIRNVFEEELSRGGPSGQTRAERPLAAPADLKASRTRSSDDWAQGTSGQPQRAEIKAAIAPTRQNEAVPAAIVRKPAAAEEKAPRSRAEKELFAAIETLRKGGKTP